MDKKVVYLTVSLGGFIGSYLPVWLFHADGFSVTSIVCGAIGSFIGLYIGIKLMNI